MHSTMNKLFLALSKTLILMGFLFLSCSAEAQWQTSNHSIPIGRGAGVTGFSSITGVNDQVVMGATGLNPAYVSIGNCATALIYNTSTHAWGCNATIGAGFTVSASAATWTGTVPNANLAAVNLGTGGNGGVTGLLGLSNLATISADFLVGNFTGSTASPGSIGIGNCLNALTYNTSTHAFGCNSTAGTGTVTSVNCAGTSITSSGNCIGTLVNIQFFFTPGTPTYTRGANVTHALGACVGAGGGGGGTATAGANQVIVSSSGGGGGFAMDYIVPSATETITVPAGGAGGASANPGVAGGNASIGTKVVATGGSGGSNNGSASVETAQGALGGQTAGMTGSVKVAGNPGINGWGSFTLGLNSGGPGGNGAGWFGGAGGQGNVSASGTGNTAVGIGGGGSGANSFNGGGAQTGGSGFQGGCMIMEFQ